MEAPTAPPVRPENRWAALTLRAVRHIYQNRPHGAISGALGSWVVRRSLGRESLRDFHDPSRRRPSPLRPALSWVGATPRLTESAPLIHDWRSASPTSSR